MCPANERRRCNVTTSLIGWAHSPTEPWDPIRVPFYKPFMNSSVKSEETFFMFPLGIDGLVKERHNSSALAMELCLSWTIPSIYNDLIRSWICTCHNSSDDIWDWETVTWSDHYHYFKHKRNMYFCLTAAITWTNVDLSTMRIWGIHWREISQEIFKISILDMSLKMTNPTLQQHFPVANELTPLAGFHFTRDIPSSKSMILASSFTRLILL